MPKNRADSKKVIAVVLAAGASARFGSSKLLVEVDGRPLVQRAAGAARDCCGDRSVLVAGHDAARVIAGSGRACQFLLVNDDYRNGLGSSIALAARALQHCADALLLMLADQALIRGDDLKRMLRYWDGTDDAIVASRFGGTLGPPALFGRATFARLAALHGDQGARPLFDEPAFRLTDVRCERAGFDVDTPADLEALRQRSE